MGFFGGDCVFLVDFGRIHSIRPMDMTHFFVIHGLCYDFYATPIAHPIALFYFLFHGIRCHNSIRSN